MVRRSFATKLDVFLFCEVIKSGTLKEDLNLYRRAFNCFSLKDVEILSAYEAAWSKKGSDVAYLSASIGGGMTYKQLDDLVIDWKKRHKDSFLKVLRADYEASFVFDPDGQMMFRDFYKEHASERVCSYCEISDAQISELRKDGKIKTKRGRGHNMEIDRKNSNREYHFYNVRLACYWCNNAKTDEFDEVEFEEVGMAIKGIWKNRRTA